MLDWNEVQIAYQIGKQYFTIQTAEDGYDYTFYNEDYQEDDGGIYDNPTIYVDEAASDILEDKRQVTFVASGETSKKSFDITIF